MSLLGSIIIPSYNTAALLPLAVNSALNSSFNDFEIIIIDDGSVDNTKEVVEQYWSDDKRVKYYFQQNKGLAGARNTGIQKASGKYLVFLDSDDIILQEKLHKQVDFLEKNLEYDAVYSKSVFFIEDSINKTVTTNFPCYQGSILNKLFYGNFIHVNSIMCRKSVVENVGLFNEQYRELEDWDLWLRMSVNGSKFGYIDEILSMVMLRKGSMTSNQLKMNKAMVKVLENLKNILKTKPELYSRFKYDYYYALNLFKINANINENYFNGLIKSLKETGPSFLVPTIKLSLKQLYSRIFPLKNKTTASLEEVWNGK